MSTIFDITALGQHIFLFLVGLDLTYSSSSYILDRFLMHGITFHTYQMDLGKIIRTLNPQQSHCEMGPEKLGSLFTA